MPPVPSRSATLAVAVLAVSLTLGAEAAATDDAYLCYGARRMEGFSSRLGLELRDRLAGARAVDARRPKGLCVPATIGRGAPGDVATFLQSYRARPTRTRPRQPRLDVPEQSIVGPLGPATVRLRRSLELLVPSRLEFPGGEPPDQTRHFQCYGARTVTPRARVRVELDDRFGSNRQFDIGKPTRLCLRTDKNGEDPEALAGGKDLLCYRARLARTRPAQPRPTRREIETQNQLGTNRLKLGPSRELCVPVTTLTLPTPTPSPISTPRPTTTVGDGVLERITIRPPEIARLPTEVKHFWATGHFSNGAARDMTNEVVWATSDSTVATAPNDPNDPNLIDLHEIGTTEVSATDPTTGVSSAATDDNAILHVTGPLRSIRVHPFYGRAAEGSFEHFTAVGCYQRSLADTTCVRRNITQDVVWTTVDPGIAEAPNEEGDRSRILAARPGLTGVYATDPATGIASSRCLNPAAAPWCGPIVAVLGQLETIELIDTGAPRFDFFNLRAGDTARVAAIGRYEGGGFKHIMQECLLQSSDASVFATPNVPGDRGVFHAVGGGDATLTAIHPASGVTSFPFTHFVYGDLLGIDIVDWHLSPLARPLGTYGVFSCCERVRGIYPGRTGPLFDWELTVDDPTMAQVNGRWITGLRLGTVNVGVRDIATGIESTERRPFTFFGELDRLELTPLEVVLRVGDEDQLTALFHYDGGHSEVVTQQSSYESTDPTVVEAPNPIFDWTNSRSLIVARGPGEATISARRSGVSSSDSGDDTHVTVVGELVSLTITPPTDVTGVGRSQQFTATGTDAAGRSINLTQVVTWSTSDAGIAEATNTDGDRSRVHGRATGSVTVSAFDPVTGLSSAASGGDAALTVRGPVGALLLLPESLPLLPGSDFQLTALGIAADGTLNITQQVDYTSDDPSVATVTGTEDDRSRITAVGPGTARITATDPVTGLVSNETVVTVADPGP